MNKLQRYFEYFDKHYGVDHWSWYKLLKRSIDNIQAMKKDPAMSGFETLSEDEKKTRMEDILDRGTNGRLKNVDDFFYAYLFEQDNDLGNLSQGVIWDSENNPHVTEIKLRLNADILHQLLTKDLDDANALLKDILDDVSRNYEAARVRFLRAIFPDLIAAVDAPNKFNRLTEAIRKKLNIHIGGDTAEERHKHLMDSVECADMAKKQIFFWELYDMLFSKLDLKKAIIYFGAPGTGKTYHSKHLATQFIDQHRIKIGRSLQEPYGVTTVQFHPSYAYEDFFEGIRPAPNGDLKLFNGTFKQFCKDNGHAEIELLKDEDFVNNEAFKKVNYDLGLIKVSDLNEKQREILGTSKLELGTDITVLEVIEPAFFIIDEINRADLSRVFGELMYSLEYRGYTGMIKTQYAYLNTDKDLPSVFFWKDGSDQFFVPQNIYLVGTMNNIDRSVDSFDFALRRRFIWEEVEPNLDVIRHLVPKWGNELADNFEQLNKEIVAQKLLGKDYRLGQAYALNVRSIAVTYDSISALRELLWKDFIRPLLQEYLRGLGDANRSDELLKNFKKAFGL